MGSPLAVDEAVGQERPPAVLCSSVHGTSTHQLGTTSELHHPACCFTPTFVPTVAFHLHCDIRALWCWHLSTAQTAPSSQFYRVTATKRQEKLAGPAACRGNTFMGASDNASCQSLKLQTEIKPRVCLFDSFREKHLNILCHSR